MTDAPFFIARDELLGVFSPRAARQFEQLQQAVADQGEVQAATVDATVALRDAAFVVLSPNADLPNEFVLQAGSGIGIEAGEGVVTLFSRGPRIAGSFPLTFVVSGPSAVVAPLTGTLATQEGAEVLHNKTLDAPRLSGLASAVDDAAAAMAGVPVGGVYRDGSTLKVRAS